MNNIVRVALRASLLASLMAASLAAGAAPVSAAMPDGAAARFDLGAGDGGIVFVSYSGSTTVNAGVIGLVSNAHYRLRGSSQDCDHTLKPRNKVFRISGMTDADGVLWLRRSPSVGAMVRSVWLGPSDGSTPPVCAMTFNFAKVTSFPSPADAILGIWDKEHVLSLLVARPNDQARLTIVADGGTGDDTLTVRGVNTRCGTRPTHTSFVVHFDRPVDAGAFKSQIISITPNEMGMIRSERAAFGTHRECAGIIAVLVGL